MSLRFELAQPARPPEGNRADIACFIGHVARRPGVALPAGLRAQLDAAGWLNGIWARPAGQIERLDNLPVALDSWEQFDALFAWEARPVDRDGRRACATYLGAAVRGFFGHGGRRAIIIRVGDPWPLLEDGGQRAARRRARIRRMLPDFAWAGAPEHPFDPGDPATWQGIQHLYGRREASLVLLPDLAENRGAGDKRDPNGREPEHETARGDDDTPPNPRLQALLRQPAVPAALRTP